jgi:hypothetical protein
MIVVVSDRSDEFDEFDDDDDENDDPDDATAFERTSAGYSGIDIGEEFQPVDEVELDEEGMLLDDPERMAELFDGADDPDGSNAPPRPTLDPDDLGWGDDDG